MGKNKRYLIIIFLFIFSSFVGLLMFWGSRRIIGGVATTGKIIDIETSISDGNTLYKPIYEFHCNNQKRIQGTNGYSNDRYIIGEENTIRCNGDNEYINNSTSLNIIGGLISFCPLIRALFLLYKGMTSFLLKKKLYQYGNRVTSTITDIYATGTVINGRTGYEIVTTENNHLFKSEGIFNDNIYVLKKMRSYGYLNYGYR